MGKYFGTDGIRGIAGEQLDGRLAYSIGIAAAKTLKAEKKRRLKALVGKDTRISSDMLESALVAGLCSGGVDVVLLGVVPTPAVAFLTVKSEADMGIMISASHNSFEHNGIKIFSSDGFKLTDAEESEIEGLIDSPDALTALTGGDLGRVIESKLDVSHYIDNLIGLAEGDFKNMKIAIDCANGSASATAGEIFSALGGDVQIVNCRPDGININEECGSTHINLLQDIMREGDFDIGFAFDGDADRCLAVDENGCVIQGDIILAMAAKDLKDQGKLRNNLIVGTITSNSGLDEYGKSMGIEVLRADVGDKHVLDLMQKRGACVGGESSGHMIFLDDATSGDGQLTAIKLLNIMARSGRKASDMLKEVPEYPQVSMSVKADEETKKRKMAMGELHEAVENARRQIGDAGSVLVRPSGTEPIIRITVEAKTEELAHDYAKMLTEIIDKL